MALRLFPCKRPLLYVKEVAIISSITRHRNWLSSINSDSGAWLSAGVSPKMFGTSNSDFVSATCRRSAVEDVTTPKRAALTSRENLQSLYKAIDTAA